MQLRQQEAIVFRLFLVERTKHFERFSIPALGYSLPDRL
jgi:hypothetical protein